MQLGWGGCSVQVAQKMHKFQFLDICVLGSAGQGSARLWCLSLCWVPGWSGWLGPPPAAAAPQLHVGGEVQCVPLQFREGNWGMLQVVEEDLDLWRNRGLRLGPWPLQHPLPCLERKLGCEILGSWCLAAAEGAAEREQPPQLPSRI